MNAAIEVGKYGLDIALGSDGELVSEPKESRGITRLAKRLAEQGCERVLINGGSYQNVLVAALRAVGLSGDHQSAPGPRIRQEHRSKTDRLDPRVLALYGEPFQPPVREFPDEQNQTARTAGQA